MSDGHTRVKPVATSTDSSLLSVPPEKIMGGQSALAHYPPIKVKKVTARAEAKIPSGVWATGAPVVWSDKGENLRGRGCKIAVIDSGIDDTHPDLKGRVIGRRDYVKDNLPSTKWGLHGTHVAGTIAANGTNLYGVAPEALLMDYRVFPADEDAGASFEVITQAIRDATRDGAHIITMSLGGAFDYEPMHQAIKDAVDKGILVVCAAGNEGLEGNPLDYPGYYPEVVSTGAVDFNVQTGEIDHLDWPSFNNQVDVCADGLNVYSTIPGGQYAYLDGTSMATPHITGFAALLHEKARKKLNRVPNEADLFAFLKMMAVDVLVPGRDDNTGVGFVTFYSEIPKKKGNAWIIPSLQTGSPN